MTTETANQPARLTAIELDNFKGIGERVRIELKPITLLFGANSAGKSTMLQALQYVREVLERRNANPDRTLHGGDFVDLGGFRNLVHGRQLSRRITIKLDLALNSATLPDLMPESFEDWQANLSGDPDSVWEFYERLQETRNLTTLVSICLEVSWNSLRQTAVVTGYEAGVNGEWLAKITATEDGRDVSIRLNKLNPIFLRAYTQEERESIDAALDDLDDWVSPGDINTQAGSDQVSLSKSAPLEAQLPADTYSVLPEILGAIREAGVGKPGAGLRTWLTGFDSALPHLGELLSVPAGGSGGSANVYIAREFAAFLSSLVVGPGVLIRDCLRNLRYLGPIRNVPRRDIEAALTPDEARWADGIAAWECLMTGEDSLVQAVSEWMSAPDKLNTGYEVKRRTIREVTDGLLNWVTQADDQLSVRSRPDVLAELEQAPSKNRVELIEVRTGLRAQPRDVGIGISQVLPVVVAALQPSAGLVAIEQPELHIHPAVQVGLGDLFARAATDNGSVFLIETHSEHLILRLLRRIRETTDGELPPGRPALSPDQLSVIYVERSDAGVRLTALPIDATGEFKARWPAGFFEERAGELF
jgi:predicted ATPase